MPRSNSGTRKFTPFPNVLVQKVMFGRLFSRGKSGLTSAEVKSRGVLSRLY